MATDLTLYLLDQPGELARVGDVLGKAGTNIAGLCALPTGGGQAEVHILVHDATPAFEALQGAGIKIAAEQEVIVLDMEDRPGALGEVARKLGKAHVNLTTVYLATNADSTRRNGNLAVQRAAQALQASGERTPELLDTLAAAYAEAGQFAQAVTLAREARSGAAAARRMDLVEQIEHRLRLYEQGQPFHAAVAGE